MNIYIIVGLSAKNNRYLIQIDASLVIVHFGKCWYVIVNVIVIVIVHFGTPGKLADLTRCVSQSFMWNTKHNLYILGHKTRNTTCTFWGTMCFTTFLQQSLVFIIIWIFVSALISYFVYYRTVLCIILVNTRRIKWNVLCLQKCSVNNRPFRR